MYSIVTSESYGNLTWGSPNWHRKTSREILLASMAWGRNAKTSFRTGLLWVCLPVAQRTPHKGSPRHERQGPSAVGHQDSEPGGTEISSPPVAPAGPGWLRALHLATLVQSHGISYVAKETWLVGVQAQEPHQEHMRKL